MIGYIILGAFAVITLGTSILFFCKWRKLLKERDDYQDHILKGQRDEVQMIYRTMRGWRHDYHNHMQKMKAHIALGQMNEVVHYLDQLEEDLDSIDIAVRTGNVSLDAILSSKLSVVRRKNIEVNCKAQVPKELSISDIDLCVIIGNLIDNAVEACDEMSKESHKYLRIYMGIFKQQLYISMTNSTSANRRRSLTELLTKKMGDHGHGFRRIDFIVKKYEGYINRKNEPGVFVTELMFPL